jgi:hypothetical protein
MAIQVMGLLENDPRRKQIVVIKRSRFILYCM